MPLRVSGVEPLLLMTTTKVSASLSPRREQHARQAVGVGVVDEVRHHLVGRVVPQRVGHEHGSQGRAADPDREQLGEAAGRLRFDLRRVDLGGERLDRRERAADLRRDLGGWGEVWRAQPVVADHPVFIGVGDRSLLQGVHRREGLFHGRRHAGEEIVVELHPADVEAQAHRRHEAKMGFVAVPQVTSVHHFTPCSIGSKCENMDRHRQADQGQDAGQNQRGSRAQGGIRVAALKCSDVAAMPHHRDQADNDAKANHGEPQPR